MSNPKLFCTLNVTFVDCGFFVPRGTPVEIVEWNSDGQLIVRSNFCVQQNNSEHSTIPVIAGVYYFEVKPDSLKYLLHEGS